MERLTGTDADGQATRSTGRLAVEVRDVARRYGGVQALAGVSIAVARGTVYALVGENGAGKSTLGKIVAGVVRPDEGQLLLDGVPVRIRSPRDALLAGVTLISQEGAVVPRRSVVENVFLGQESRRLGVLRGAETRRRYLELAERIGFEADPDAIVGDLRLADRQKVEILRALGRDARVLVMDEPTAALGEDDTKLLLETVRALAAGGTTIIFVSHFLEEVLQVADTVSVMRDGRLVRTSPAAEETAHSLVQGMLGRGLNVTFPPSQRPPAGSPVVLSVRDLRAAGLAGDVSLEIRAGEILGVAGLVGSGRSELARAIFGADRRDGGEVVVDGEPVRGRHPRDGVRAGLALLPEDRKSQALLALRSVGENLTIAHLDSVTRLGVVSPRRERTAATDVAGRLGVRAPLGAAAGTLSGGNQQKLLFGRWLMRPPKVLLADEPTRGVDVGAKLAIYELIVELAQKGMAVLVISSEMEEVLGLAHRVLVMRAGHVVAEYDNDGDIEDDVMHAAFATVGNGDPA